MTEVSLNPLPEENPKQCYKRTALRIVESKLFEHIITTCVGINLVALCLEYYGSPPMFDYILKMLNLFFVIAFLIEALIKMLGWGVTHYFKMA